MCVQHPLYHLWSQGFFWAHTVFNITLAQLNRALVYETKGWGFESLGWYQFGLLVKWDNSAMAWQHREFDSPTVHQFGVWRSPVAHLHGVQGAAGSNPATPTNILVK